ncbi:hypothetical protein SS50377_21830 [Spironucleus salmonicida]|uniref:Uncharacterized protein n=1 Tax=Spironucleus salmonicida TaxID=348837 RepID=V6LU92_9EUKA|nr:hypothetical protein SS50377_21830 [Spironucleus salmonicida]|eukprot:EST44374.1 Hypothetical protein SS50377_15677 [Spironucleus salmonicida]
MKVLVANGLFQQKQQLPLIISSLKRNKIYPSCILTIDKFQEKNPFLSDSDFKEIVQKKICQNIIRVNLNSSEEVKMNMGPLKLIKQGKNSILGRRRLKQQLKNNNKPYMLLVQENSFQIQEQIGASYLLSPTEKDTIINDEKSTIFKSSWIGQGSYMILNIKDTIRSCDIVKI